jgi:hypothetical protein
MSVILVLRSHRQEDLEFKVSLGYIARPYFKKKKKFVLHTWDKPGKAI